MEKKILFRGIQKYPLLAAVITQVLVLFFLRNIFVLTSTVVNLWFFVFFQAFLSALICHLILRLPKWFIVISFLLPVLFTVAWTYLHFAAGTYGIIFIVLALTFSHTLKERVPLYLSNHTTHEALIKLIAEQKAKKVMDLGSGLGGVVRALASANIISHGVESAPILWFLSGLHSLIMKKGVIFRKNIWDCDFKEYDIIYAFLSPAIMEKLFLKIKSEMKPGSLFISNSFQVPGIRANEIRNLDDGRKTKLFIYKI